MIKTEKRFPGSFSEKDIIFNKNIIEKCNTITLEEINLRIKDCNKEMIDIYQNKYIDLLKLTGATFDIINSETQRKADDILCFSLIRKPSRNDDDINKNNISKP